MTNYEYIYLNKAYPYHLFRFISQDNQRIIPVHYHQEVEILFCEKGSLIIWIEGKKVKLEEGDLYFINKNIPHSTQSKIGSRVMVMYQNSDIFDEEEVMIMINQDERGMQQRQELITIINRIFYLQKITSDRFVKYTIQSELCQLNYLLLTYFSMEIDETAKRKIRQNLKFNKVLSIVNEAFDQNMNLNELSILSGYSVPYLSRLFKKHTGGTFLEYKNSLSLEKALKLIDTTDDDLESIAFLSGFSNEKSMRTAFKKGLNMTPIKYKMSKNDRL